MKTLNLAFAALATITAISLAAAPANAAGFGIYVSSGYGYPSYYAATPSYYNSGYGYNTGYGGYYYEDDVHHDDHHGDLHHGDVWHDTSHIDYRPSRLVRHGNHLHYIPGRYEIHRTGHWDHVHW